MAKRSKLWLCTSRQPQELSTLAPLFALSCTRDAGCVSVKLCCHRVEGLCCLQMMAERPSCHMAHSCAPASGSARHQRCKASVCVPRRDLSQPQRQRRAQRKLVRIQCSSQHGTTQSQSQHKAVHDRAEHRSGAVKCMLAAALLCASSMAPALAESVASGPVDGAAYVPGPVNVGWQIYVGAAVAAFPFVIGSFEFGKRILIQRRCDGALAPLFGLIAGFDVYTACSSRGVYGGH